MALLHRPPFLLPPARRCHGASSIVAVLLLLLLQTSATGGLASSPLDSKGNIAIRWDVLQWLPDGYQALVTLTNSQLFRHVQPNSGWSLQWTWAQTEVIWSMIGAETTLQGDCSKFHGALPYSCERSPEVVDLQPNGPNSSQIAGCCKGGVLSAVAQDRSNTIATFKVSVGSAGTTPTTVVFPKDFKLQSPGQAYRCTQAKRTAPTVFKGQTRHSTQALETWALTCLPEARTQKTESCCVSFSSVYKSGAVPCSGCQNGTTSDSSCMKTSGTNPDSSLQGYTSQLYCTKDMCGYEVHWSIQADNGDYCKAKVTITNRNVQRPSYSWNLVMQAPFFDTFTKATSFSHEQLDAYDLGNTAMFRGSVLNNNVDLPAGSEGGVVDSEVWFKKQGGMSCKESWFVPDTVLLNGQTCGVPKP